MKNDLNFKNGNFILKDGDLQLTPYLNEDASDSYVIDNVSTFMQQRFGEYFADYNQGLDDLILDNINYQSIDAINQVDSYISKKIMLYFDEYLADFRVINMTDAPSTKTTGIECILLLKTQERIETDFKIQRRREN